jgi:autotransporter-associated beta strand protein
MDLRRNAGRCTAPLGLALLALASGPAQAQWNYYSNASNSFYVPFVAGGSPDFRYVSLTLPYGSSTKTTAFVMDTGSLGILAGTNAYSPGAGDIPLGPGGITYTSDGTSGAGNLFLTTVTINGQNGQTATARVPILQSLGAGGAQMGIGFARTGLQAQSGIPLPNLNPFLGLLTINGQPVTNMNPGYIISTTGFQTNGQSFGPGVMLGLTQQLTNNFSFVQLTPTGLPLPAGCTTAGMNCPVNWNAATASVAVNGQNVGNLSMLPDSGIGFMILSVPNGGITTVPGQCGVSGTTVRCLPSGTQVQLYLPGQTQAAATYTFTVDGSGNPVQPTPGVQVIQAPTDQLFVNTGRNFFNGYDYLYDPIGGFVGYRLNGTAGTNAVAIPLLALQGNLALQNGFAATFPTYLMAPVTLQQTGSGAFNNTIFGPGSLTLNSGTVTLAGANSYTGGTIVNGGTLNLTGSITGDLAVGPNATFVNSGTVNSPGYWLSNQGTFTNSGTIVGNFANVATTTNTGTFTGSVINGTGGSFVNNGSVGGDFLNIGVLSGNGTIGGNFFNMGVMAPGNSIGTINVAGNFVNAANGTYLAEVVGQGQSDRITVGGSALLQGGTVVVSVLPGLAFAPSTRYTLLSAAGGLSGTFGSVNELYPFLQSSLSYDANDAYLTLQVGGFAAVAQNPLQYAVGSVLDASAPNASGDYATVLGTLATATTQQGQAFMTAISGNNYAGFSSSMVQGAQLFMNNFASQTGGGNPFGTRVALAEACDVACDPTQAPQWGAWGGGLGGLGTIGANQPLGTVTYNVGGFAAGLDRLITPTTRLGVTAGYTGGTQWVGGFDGVGRTDTFQTGLYGGYAQGPVYADAVVGYAYGWNQMWRTIPIPGLGQRTAQGRTGANQFFGQAETGYRFDLGTSAQAFVTPFARLQAYTGTQNAFTETGAQSLNLTVAQQTTNSLRSVLGAQLGGAIDLGWREKLAMQFRLGWAHEYADTGRPVTATLAGAPGMAFTTYGVAPQRDGAVVGFSANTAIAEATSLYLRYEGVISGQDSAHALTAGVRMTW